MSDEDDFPALPAALRPTTTPGIVPPTSTPAVDNGATVNTPPSPPVDGHTVLGRKMPPPPFPPEQSSMVVPAYEFPARIPRGVWGFVGGVLIGLARPWTLLRRGRRR